MKLRHARNIKWFQIFPQVFKINEPEPFCCKNIRQNPIQLSVVKIRNSAEFLIGEEFIKRTRKLGKKNYTGALFDFFAGVNAL